MSRPVEYPSETNVEDHKGIGGGRFFIIYLRSSSLQDQPLYSNLNLFAPKKRFLLYLQNEGILTGSHCNNAHNNKLDTDR